MDHFFAACGLNAVYLVAAIGVFMWSFGRARVLGKLMNVGE